ncbi:flagellar basal body-associated FliL family protein [Thiomicrorhabdus sediminis]|uniref:Flagellar protein FliL n=1 Tax=Thiomicrorhabdus sediminis TaxID=2580412 RepID=A0A4P9K5V8_9GAMM|nr:flagellar basal body-associated FliL family protein [Thiomicrorhabdus sediminis]QCU89647.1 flagellar basal body-associated FliL family protein [Thiomicrorhabdus sediminis]
MISMRIKNLFTHASFTALLTLGAFSVTAQPVIASENSLSYSPKYKQFEEPETRVPQYFSMDKVVVNFQGEGQAKFLAVDFKFMSYIPQVVEVEMEHLRPILKNDIDRVLRQQRYSKLRKPDGPDQLRAEVLAEVKKVLEQHRIYPDLLEDVYLGRFVMQ